MATPSAKPKVAQIVKARPATYLGHRIQYMELRSGKRALNRVSIGEGGKSVTEATRILRGEAKRLGYTVTDKKR